LTLPEVQALKDRVQWQVRTDISNNICLHPDRHNPQDNKTVTNATQNTISTSDDNFIDSILHDDVKVKHNHYWWRVLVEHLADFTPNTRPLCALIGHHYSSCPFKQL